MNNFFCFTEVQSKSQYLCIFYFSLSSRRKLVAYLNSSQNFPLKNVYFYQGMMPISKVKNTFSIC